MAQSAKPISSPVPDVWYPSLSVLMLAVGLIITASFFIYEATSSRKSRSLAKELVTGAVASIFLVRHLIVTQIIFSFFLCDLNLRSLSFLAIFHF